MFERLTSKIINAIHLWPGDSLVVSYNDGKTEHELESIKLDHKQTVNRIDIHKVANEYGFENGYAVLLGKSNGDE